MKKIYRTIITLAVIGLSIGAANAQTTWNIGTPTAASVTATLSGNTLTLAPTFTLTASATPATSIAAGTGTSADPYIITTADELAFMAQQVNAGDAAYVSAYYKLGNDIDLSAYGAAYDSGNGWTPIGLYNETLDTGGFLGDFDGCGHVISNLYINRTGSEFLGLFGAIKGTVKNLGVAGTVSGHYYIGGIAGLLLTGTIENCYFSGAVSCGSNRVGGITGEVRSNAILKNCYVVGMVSGQNIVGGIAGYVSGSTVSNCYAVCTVSGNNYVGGIAGQVYSNSILKNCYAIGTVSGSSIDVGGIAGTVSNSTVSNCAALNESVSGSASVGRVVGYVSGSPTISGNIAYSGMTITENGSYYYSGTSITAAAIRADGTLNGLFANDGNPWTTANGYLPGFGAPVALPLYLAAAPTIGTLTTPAAVTTGQTLTLTAPTVAFNGAAITAEGWQISATNSATPGDWAGFSATTTMTVSGYNGYYLRYYATNGVGTAYSNAVQITVNKGTPTVTTSPTAANIYKGDALSASALTGGAASVAGTFAWTAPATVVTTSGSFGVTFTPTDTANYNTATTTVSVTVIDRDALDAKIAEAQAITRGSYTQATWDALQAAIASAGAVQATAATSNTQAAVDAEVAALTAAIAGLSNNSGGGGYYPTYYTVTFNTDGGGAVSSQSVSYGGKLTKPTDPTKDGYNFGGWFKDTALTQAYDFNTAVTSGFTLYAKWIEKSVNPPDKWNNPFVDVHENDWFYGDVEYVFTHGLMVGTAADKFSPSMALTRGMIVTILYRQVGEPSMSGLTNPFDDVAAGQYYTDAVKWAAANGIVSGYGNGTFGPNDPITREQLAAIIYRYACFIGKGPTGLWLTNLPFDDKADISGYATEAVTWCWMKGIVKGRPGNVFDPKGQATRAEVAAMLHRFLIEIED